MKRSFTLLSLLLITCVLMLQQSNGQIPGKMSYQSVVRDASNNLLKNQSVGMRISILQGSSNGSTVYTEIHTVTSNINGLVTLEIGTGITSNDFSSIDWANGPFFVKTETDPTGGKNYSISGVSQLLSVPYAFHSSTAKSLTNPIIETDPAFGKWDKSTGIVITESQISNLKHFTNADETDPLFGSSTARGITSSDTANWNNKSDFNGNYQTLKNLPVIPSKTSELSNDAGFITDPNDADHDPTNELQVLRISHDTVYLTQGGFIKLPSSFDGQYSSLTGKPNFSAVATTGSYSDLAGKPTSLSQFNDDQGYQKKSEDGDTDPSNEIQYLYKGNDNNIGLSNGGWVHVPDFETDPLFSSSAVSGINASHITNWNNKLSSYTETDPLFSAWNKSSGISISESQISDLNHFTNTDETDPVFAASLAKNISTSDTTRWASGNIWNKNGNNIYYTLGKVGIGSSDPATLNISSLNVEGGIRYTGSSTSTTPGLLFYDPSGNGAFKYFDNLNAEQVLGTGTITYSGSLWTNTGGDIVGNNDVICQGSLAVGFDAVGGESFGFATIILKENNLRIKFDDTSASAGFPANDWQLTANESASGGANYFAIEDLTGYKIPFKVMAGAPTNSFYLSSAGKLGIKTGTPVLDIHILSGDTPAIRMEQSGGGFTPQTWDVAGNEANFFIRDVTGGSLLPFRIRPGAPTSSIDISTVGNVGIGTSSPARKLHVMDAMRLEPTTEPASPSAGDLYFDQTSNKLRCYDGTIWHDLW